MCHRSQTVTVTDNDNDDDDADDDCVMTDISKLVLKSVVLCSARSL